MSHPVKAVKDFWSDDNDLIKVFLFRKQILAELSRACPKQSKSLARGDAAHHCFGKTAGGKVALADLVIFTRQLATMIDAGLAMVQSLQALAEQTSNKVMRDVIKECEGKKRPIYLETSMERNLPFYKKFGFEIFKSLQLTYTLYQLRRI